MTPNDQSSWERGMEHITTPALTRVSDYAKSCEEAALITYSMIIHYRFREILRPTRGRIVEVITEGAFQRCIKEGRVMFPYLSIAGRCFDESRRHPEFWKQIEKDFMLLMPEFADLEKKYRDVRIELGKKRLETARLIEGIHEGEKKGAWNCDCQKIGDEKATCYFHRLLDQEYRKNSEVPNNGD